MIAVAANERSDAQTDLRSAALDWVQKVKEIACNGLSRVADRFRFLGEG